MLVASPGSGELLPAARSFWRCAAPPSGPRLWPAEVAAPLARRPVCWWWLHLLRWRCGGSGGSGGPGVGSLCRAAGQEVLSGPALCAAPCRYDDPETKKFKLNAERNNGRAAMMGITGMIVHNALGVDSLFPIVS